MAWRSKCRAVLGKDGKVAAKNARDAMYRVHEKGKPDRHLMRVAAETGYGDPERMCRAVSQIVGDPLPVIDIVIGR